MEELFNGQLSFADIEAEKFLQILKVVQNRHDTQVKMTF